MPVHNLLYKKSYPVTDRISIEIPTVGEILDDEDSYYSMVSIITAAPCDMMVQLDDLGIDFTAINEYDLFLILFNLLRSQDTSMIFGDLDLTIFKTAINHQNDMVVLKNDENDIVIDRAIHGKICDAIRKIHHLEKSSRKPANEAAKKFLIERERIKMNRRKGRVESSQLEDMIISLINTEQFNYGFDGVQGLTIYQFTQSVHQIIKKIDFDNKMRAVYAGTIKASDLNQKDLNWLTNK
jgi:hypothetical protein